MRGKRQKIQGTQLRLAFVEESRGEALGEFPGVGHAIVVAVRSETPKARQEKNG